MSVGADFGVSSEKGAKRKICSISTCRARRHRRLGAVDLSSATDNAIWPSGSVWSIVGAFRPEGRMTRPQSRRPANRAMMTATAADGRRDTVRGGVRSGWLRRSEEDEATPQRKDAENARIAGNTESGVAADTSRLAAVRLRWRRPRRAGRNKCQERQLAALISAGLGTVGLLLGVAARAGPGVLIDVCAC